MNSNQPEQPLILIVDDDPFIQMQLRLYLEREGYRTIIISNGEEALSAYTRDRPQLVLLDAIMSGMNGFDCCAKLMKLPEATYTPVLMITALDDQQSVDQAFNAGATDYVTKPIHWAVLRQRVRRLLHQAQLQKDLEAANQSLYRMVSIDGLTQISNRRRFDEYFQKEWLRMAREQLPLSLILCDVDCFKAYNDAYGHQAGDKCLQQIAKAIDSIVQRPADLVARYGGEEFVVILPNTNATGALCVAEKICLKVRDLKIFHVHSAVSNFVTISLGVTSVVPSREDSKERLIARADKALYQAKNQGRDRVVCDP